MWSSQSGAEQNIQSPPQQGEGEPFAGQALDWESASGIAAGFPRTLGILFDSAVFHLVGCGERSSLFLLPLVSGVKWVEDVPCTSTVPSTA